jgi:HEAT repeats
MSDARPINRTEEDGRPGKEEIASAAEVLQTMLKTSKAFRIYSPNSPLRQKFIDESTEKTVAHLDRYEHCQFEVDQFSVFYRGTRILESRDAKESIAFRMYSDGIRSIHFSEGIRSQEICDFLEIVGQDRPADVDDDIVTLLWMKDLPHVSYILAEDFLEVDVQKGAFPAVASQREGIRKVYHAQPEPEAQQVPQQAPQNIQPLTAEEAAALKKETTAEEMQDPLQEVMRVLASILAGEKDLELFQDFLGIVDNLIANLFHAGRIGDALRLIRFLQKMEANESVAGEKRELIRAGCGEKVTADAVLALQKPIDGDGALSPDDLIDLFRYLGARHIGAVCELLGKIQQMKMRKAAISALATTGKETPRAFYPFLQDHRWFLVRNIVLILTLIGDAKCLGAVASLAGHPDPQVRKEVFSYLQKHPDQRARAAMMRFLDDESAALRIRTLQVLSAAKFTPALQEVEARIAENNFAERDLQEKCAFYGAFGALGGDSVVPQLQRMVMKRHWLNRSKQNEIVACAVTGLRKARTPAALEALQKAQERHNGSELESLISNALKELEAVSGASLAAGEKHE